MKTKFFLLIGIFTLALTACEGDDNNGDDPTKPLDDAQISFTKMANCPDAEVDQAIVWKDAIYYVNRTSFLRYTPAKNEWQSLAPAPSTNLFVWQDKLYCFYNSSDKQIYVYADTTDSWEIADDIPIFNEDGNRTNGIYKAGNKLFADISCGSYYTYHVYLLESKQWKNLKQNLNFDFLQYACQIGDKVYYNTSLAIFQFDPESCITTQKLSISRPSYSTGGKLAVCSYNPQQMLYTLSGGKNGDYRVTTGIYTPSTNEYSEKVFGNNPHGLTEVTIADIPMAINLLTYFDGRFFVGPNNAAFYELKIK